MKLLRFEGYSDDTFGELTTSTDYDNCANGDPIIFKVWSAQAKDGLYVIGHYCPGPLSGWMVGVGRLNDDDDCHMPNWPIRIVSGLGQPYTPRLVIHAPDDATVEHWVEVDGDFIPAE